MISKLFKYAPVQILSAFSLFLLISIQTRYLSPNEYGLLAIFLVFTEGARSVLVQWINNCLVRFYSTSSSKLKFVSQLSFWLLVCLFLSSLVIFICMMMFNVFTVTNFAAIYLLLISKSLYLYLTECARVEERVTHYRKAVFVQSMWSVIISYITLLYYENIVSAIFALIVSYTISLVIVGYHGTISNKYNKSMKTTLLSFGLPLMISGLLGILASRSDRLLIASLTDLEQAGLYSAVSNLLMGIMSLVFMVVALPLFPELTKVVNDKSELYKKHRYYGGVICALSIPSTVGICLLAPHLVKLFLGESYQGMDLKIFYALSIATWFFNIKCHFLDHGFQFVMKTKWMPILTLSAFVIQVGISLELIPVYGAIGAAISFMLAFFVVSIFTLIVGTCLGYRYPCPQHLPETLLATMMMAISVNVTGMYTNILPSWLVIIIFISVGFLSYGSVHFMLNSFSIKDYIKGLTVNEKH